MQRLYLELVLEHLKKYRQMVFLAGPRQVGKTTIARELKQKYTKYHYFNWDLKEDRQKIISGARSLGDSIGMNELRSDDLLIVFDEIHKYPKWKLFLKGFFDLYEKNCKIVVTGSAKLNIFKRQGDSLMGRYFLYRIHPFSVGEILNPKIRECEILPPQKLDQDLLERLFQFGGFPEPYLTHSTKLAKNWQRMRQELLIQEDIKSLSQIQNLDQLDMLTDLLKSEAAQLLNYSSIAKQIDISEPTAKRWISCLEQFYFSFRLKPWSKNIRSSLRKEPKVFLWDWSVIQDYGARVENFIASHLMKSVHYWTDYGLGKYELYYLRDKQKREVDFLVVKEGIPWFLVEAKASKNAGISKSLYTFQEQTGAKHAFQVIYDMEYVDQDCFAHDKPIIVPASTFLSQLV